MLYMAISFCEELVYSFLDSSVLCLYSIVLFLHENMHSCILCQSNNSFTIKLFRFSTSNEKVNEQVR